LLEKLPDSSYGPQVPVREAKPKVSNGLEAAFNSDWQPKMHGVTIRGPAPEAQSNDQLAERSRAVRPS
jgi:hypothetical protein